MGKKKEEMVLVVLLTKRLQTKKDREMIREDSRKKNQVKCLVGFVKVKWKREQCQAVR